MDASEHAKKLGMAREVLLSLMTGTSITVLLAVLRAARVAPSLIDILLRPGLYLSRAAPGERTPSAALLALGDGVFYGLLSFVAMHLLSIRRQSLNCVSERADRRRSNRVLLSAPVFAYGWQADEPFSEKTETAKCQRDCGD